MELILNRYNYEHLNLIRDNIVRHYLHEENVIIKKYIICVKDDSFVYKICNDLTEEQKSQIKTAFDELKSTYKVLYKGSYFPVRQLKNLNYEYDNLESFVDIYYYEEGKIDDKLIDFAKCFLEKFKGEYRKIENVDKYENIINLEVYGLLRYDKIHDKINHIHLEYEDEVHTGKYDSMAEIIHTRMRLSGHSDNPDVYYKVCDLDEQNINRVNNGVSPIKFLNQEDYRSVIAFCNTSLGFPTMNLHSINRFMKGFNKEYYNLNFLTSYYTEYEKLNEISHFHRTFETELEAKCFGIYLGSENVNYLVYDKTVYYQNISVIEPLDLKNVKTILVSIYSKISRVKYNFNKFDLESLLNVYEHDGYLISYRHEINHVNPANNEVLNIDYYDRKNNTFTGIFPEFSFHGLYDLDTKFDKKNLKDLPDHDIKFSEGSVYCNNKLLISNFFINDLKRFKTCLKKLWKKGYLLNTFGLMNYIYNNKILDECIEPPVWFTLKNSNEENFFRFVENL